MARTIPIKWNEGCTTRPQSRRGEKGLEILRRLRPHVTRPYFAHAAVALASLTMLAPCYAAAAESDEVAELRRLLREVQAQNRELSRRLGALESARESGTAPRSKPAGAQEQPVIDKRRTSASTSTLAETSTDAAKGASSSKGASSKDDSSKDAAPLPEPRDTTNMTLEERVKELEVGWAAQENATRQLIADTLSKAGPNINNYLSLSGVVEMLGSRTREFDGPTKDTLALSTTELDFDIKLNNWLTGSLVLHWESGTGGIFPTTALTTVTSAGTVAGVGVDRFTLDRTHVSIGDLTRFPIAARLGQEVLHFGTSTGVARLDTLAIGTPLTTEVFENRQTAGGIEFAWPTPPQAPSLAPVTVPKVQPLVLGPAVNNLAQWLGYKPLPQRVTKPTPVTPPAEPPPFYGSFLVYKGNEEITPNRFRMQDFNAALGYRTSDHCGVPYEELQSSLVCPWEIDAHVDYNTSVFNSTFLQSSYRPFLSQIGAVPGVAASVKARFGPFAVVGEVNRAIDEVRFLDGIRTPRSITPMAWQASIAYQFGWNPWITEIGQQGNFISVAYSGSHDMAGVTDLINGVPTRVGFVPQSRLNVTAGEWPMDGLKVAIEYSANWDYPVSRGGTGQLAHGVFGLVQLNF